MQVLTATRLLVFLFHITSNSFSAFATSISANLSPTNGSVVALLPGETNYPFECDIFLNETSGELVQVTTVWTLQNYDSSGDVRTLIVQSDFEGVFLIQGTPKPFGSGTFRNRLLLLNFTEELENTILRCRSQSGETEKSGTFWLRIYRVPQLVQSQTRMVLEGANIEINLNQLPESFPFPQEYQWTRNGVVLRNTSAAVFGYPALSFLNISRSDNGQYVLTASNYRLDNPTQKLGTGVGSVYINVLYGPDLVKGPLVVTGSLGGSAKLTCGSDLVSNPEPIISWSDNQGNVVMLSGNRFFQDDDPSLLSLTVSQLEMGDTGMWTCNITVENVGMVEHYILLTVVGPPSSPQNVEVTSSGATSVHFSWVEPITLGTPTSAEILYSITAINQNDMTTISTQLQDMTSGAVDGLLPSSQYIFTVTAWSSYDGVQVASGPSSPISHVTDTTVPDVKCNSAPLSTNGMIIISWSFLHTGGLNLSLVSVSSSTETLMTWDFRPPLSKPTPVDEEGRPTALTISKLPAGSMYVFTVRAFNMLGNSSVTCPPITHEIGIPQPPKITGARSDHGQVILEVITRESGTLPPNFFQFNVKIEHAGTLKEIKFAMAEYVDGENVDLVVGTFEMSGDVEDRYGFIVSCTNDFGTSEESNPVIVAVKFTSPLSAMVTGGIAAGLGAIVVLMAVLVAMCCVCFHRHRNKKRETLKVNPLNILSRSSPHDITGSVVDVPSATPSAMPLSSQLLPLNHHSLSASSATSSAMPLSSQLPLQHHHSLSASSATSSAMPLSSQLPSLNHDSLSASSATPSAMPLSSQLPPLHHHSLSPNINPLPSQQNLSMHGSDYFSESSATEGIYDRLPSTVDSSSSYGIDSQSCNQHNIKLDSQRVGDSSIRNPPHILIQSEVCRSKRPSNHHALPPGNKTFDPDIDYPLSQLESISLNREILELEELLSGSLSEIVNRNRVDLEKYNDKLKPQDHHLYRQHFHCTHSLRTLC